MKNLKKKKKIPIYYFFCTQTIEFFFIFLILHISIFQTPVGWAGGPYYSTSTWKTHRRSNSIGQYYTVNHRWENLSYKMSFFNLLDAIELTDT